MSVSEGNALQLLTNAGFGKIDYVEVRDADNLSRLGPGAITGPARVLAAAWLGTTPAMKLRRYPLIVAGRVTALWTRR